MQVSGDYRGWEVYKRQQPRVIGGISTSLRLNTGIHGGGRKEERHVACAAVEWEECDVPAAPVVQ